MAKRRLPVNHVRGISAPMTRKTDRRNSTVTKAVRLWGKHAIIAALANPERTVLRMWGTHDALAELALPPVLPITPSGPADLARMVPANAPCANCSRKASVCIATGTPVCTDKHQNLFCATSNC